MRNKRTYIISILFIIVFIAIVCFTLYRRNNNFTSFDQMQFYTVLDDNNQKINVEFYGDNNQYEGKLFIPGEYNGEIKLFWEGQKTGKILIDNHASGQYQLSNACSHFDLFLYKEKISVDIKIYRTSPNIEPLFINIKEPFGLIDDMNNDKKHAISCYGTASFNDETYHMSIKGRGNSTWTLGEKKPYNITFLDKDYQTKQSVSMIEGIETNKWSLLANYNDPTLLRNKIGYDLANEMKIGLDSKYYDVWMNGEFLGNYLVTPKNDYETSKEGYLLEIDNQIDNENYQFHIEDSAQEIEGLMFTVKTNNSNADVKTIKKYFQEAWDAVKKYDSNEYLRYIDIDSWAKMYLLYELNKNYDVVCGSILMHRDGQGQEQKLIAGPIWDLDNAFGTLSPNPDNGLDNETMFSGGHWYINSIHWIYGDYCFLQELGKHEDFIEKVKEVYYEYEDKIIDLPNQILNYSKENQNSYLADFEKWGNDRTLHDFFTDYDWNYDSIYPINYQTTNTYSDYLDNLLKYIEARISFIDTNINNIK